MDVNAEWLFGLFCSSGGRVRGYAADFVELENLSESGELVVQEIQFEIPREPDRASSDWKHYYDAFTATTSELHGWLKWAAWNWLRSEGEAEPKYEQAYPGGKADVHGPRLGVVVECGDTAPDKLLVECGDTAPDKLVSTFSAKCGYVAWVLLPFPSDPRFYLEATLSGMKVLAYRFTSSANATKPTGKAKKSGRR
jgi:hypothetical protein